MSIPFSDGRHGLALLADIAADGRRCFFCHRSGPIAAGTYTRINFSWGIELVCDTCYERGNDEWSRWFDEDGDE